MAGSNTPVRSPDEFFVTAKDGTKLFYERRGRSQGRVLVILDGVLWDGDIWRYLFDAFSPTHQVVHPHHRGHGRSSTPSNLARVSMVDLAEDVHTVLEDAGVERCVLIGQSMGVQVALEYWHLHPERVEGLVLCNGTPGHILDTFHDIRAFNLLFPLLRRIIDKSPQARQLWHWVPPELALRVVMLTGDVNARLIHRRDLIPYLRKSRYVDLTLFLNMIDALGQHDASPYLADIDVPTLVIGAEHDTFTPPRKSEELARRIFGAELLIMRGATHAAPIEQPDLINLRIEKFLNERLGDG